MLKKTITYKDLDGNDITEDFYFNLSKAEIAEMELSHAGGLSTFIERIVEANDGGEIIAAFKNILTTAIGRRSEDGKRFIKSQEIVDEFIQSDAYSVLFMELVTDEEGVAAAEFIKGVVPADISEAVAKGERVTNAKLPEAKDEPEEHHIPPWVREDREPTDEELQSMTKEQMQEAFKRKAIRKQF